MAPFMDLAARNSQSALQLGLLAYAPSALCHRHDPPSTSSAPAAAAAAKRSYELAPSTRLRVLGL